MFDFNAPSQGLPPQTAVETRPKAVAAWLDRLPFANPADAARQLLTALQGLNRHTLDDDDRYVLLALYRPAVRRAASGLEALLADSGVPPQPHQRQIGALLRELHTEHAFGYRQIMEANPRRFGRTHPKRMAGAAAHRMAALRDIQAACYLTHTVSPPGVWQDLHHLRTFVHASRLADTVPDDAPAPDLSYRQALLLALADPPQMNHAEFMPTRLYLERFAELAKLCPPAASTPRGFAIRTDGDTPPNPFATRPDEGALWLDTEALCRHLHETMGRLRNGKTPGAPDLPPDLGLALCKRLFRQWSTRAQRSFKRYPVDGEVQVVAGVSAVHRLLEGADEAPCFEDDDDSLAIRDVGVLVAAAPIVVNATRWTVSNDSASGLALCGAPNTPLNLKVGEPLALRAEDAASWSLGVIRWIRMRDSRQIELGVERLAPQIRPVWVRPLRGQLRTNPEPALLIPGLSALKQPDRLLLPRRLYQVGMDADVWDKPRQYTLSFGRVLEHTPSFDLIEFSPIEDETP